MKKKLKQAIQLAQEFKAKCASTKFVVQDKPVRKYDVELKWTTSKAQDTYGYNICTIFVNGNKQGSCNGGGYDMKGTSTGNWLAAAFSERLYNMIKAEFYGLTFHNPTFNVMDEKLTKCDDCFTDKSDEGKTFAQLKGEGKLVDLDIHRAWYKASSKLPTEKHIYALLDGACGMSEMQKVAEAIGLKFEWLPLSNRFKNSDFYTVYDYVKEEVKDEVMVPAQS